jgi:hypothetical protein
MLPNDVCRCVPSRDCPLKESCRRFLEPGPWAADFSTQISEGAPQCGVRIPVEAAK